MERQARPAVILAVMDTNQQNLIALLFREIVPAMLRLVFDPGGFPAHILID
jgi:hypothetical protein